jgi:GT2 family glycosyltransferase
MSESKRIIARPTESKTALRGLSVVIVSMNNKGYLKPCLASLYSAGLETEFEVIVVDNGSTDGTQAMLWEKFPDVQVIQNDCNLGLSRATNQGIATSRGRYVLLLNDDTVVDGPSLNAMIRFLDTHPDGAAIGGRLLNPDGSLQAGYNHFPSLAEEFLIATRLGNTLCNGYPLREGDGQARPVDWLGSACLVLRREALSQVGLLDEQYFIYGDEVDLQYRFRHAGWRVYYLPSSRTIHYGGRSMDRWRRRKMVYRGKMLFYRKNYGRFRTALLRLIFGGLSVSKILVWCGAFAIPAWRERVRKELRSNLDVLGLCRKLV